MIMLNEMYDLTIEQAEEEMETKIQHVPVMVSEVLKYLNPKSGQCILDCTIGMAGHALAILKQVGSNGHLIGLDRDAESLVKASETLRQFSQQCSLIHEDYRNVDNVLNQLGIQEIDGMLFDLGISSFQFNAPERGFSIKLNGPLDMRMDKDSYISAYDLVNSLSEKEISSILKNFGQERWHHRIAHALVTQRSKYPIESTHDLSEIVLRAIPFRHKRQKIHPATRTFQAFRIAVNRELEALEVALIKSIEYLKIGGRICVISFHSLEDRIVKEKFRQFAKVGRIKLILSKPLSPQEEEITSNPRSRSARLRVAERIQ